MMVVMQGCLLLTEDGAISTTPNWHGEMARTVFSRATTTSNIVAMHQNLRVTATMLLDQMSKA